MSDKPLIPPPDESCLPAEGGERTPKFPIWSVWDILLLVFFSFFMLMVLVTASRAVSHFFQVHFPLWNQWIRHPASDGFFKVALQCVLDALIFIFIFLTITLKYNAPFFLSIRWIKLEKKAIGLFGSVGIALALFVLALSSLLPESGTPPIEEMLKYPATIVLYSALGVLVAPFVEEVLYRGFIYPVLERGAGRLFPCQRGHLRSVGGFSLDRGKMLAVVLTAVLFGMSHFDQLRGSWSGILLILLVGLTLSTVRAATGSVMPGFILHLAYNSTLCLVFFLGVLVNGFPK